MDFLSFNQTKLYVLYDMNVNNPASWLYICDIYLNIAY